MKLVFESFTEAADFLKERSELRPSPILAGVYVADMEERSPEESAPPMFRPQHYPDGRGIKKIHSYKHDVRNPPQDGRCVLDGDTLVLESELLGLRRGPGNAHGVLSGLI